MKKITILLVIIFTFLFSTTSWGDWSYVTKVDGIIFYYDKDRIRKSGKYIYFWVLLDYIKPDERGDLSVTQYTEGDCSIFRFKWLKVQTYKNSMGKGNTTYDITPPPDKWIYPSPKSPGDIMYNKICEEWNTKHTKKDGTLIGKVENRKKDGSWGVFYYGYRNGEFGYFKEKWEGVESENNINNGKYEGEMKNGLPNGQGSYTSSNGDMYEGEFKNGKGHGQGKRTEPDGNKYVGGHKDGKRDGQGTYTWTDGRNFEGEWKDGKRVEGIMTNTNEGDRSKFVGEFKDGDPWNGVFIDGNISLKVWNGKLIRP